MPKEHPKQLRNCVNETQIRDERTGQFIRRRDDGAVTLSVSLPAIYHEGLRRSLEIFPRRNKRPQHQKAA